MIPIGGAYYYNEADLPSGIKIGKLLTHGSYGYVHECSALTKDGMLRTDLIIKCVPLDSPTLPSLGYDNFDFQDPEQRRGYSSHTSRKTFDEEVADTKKLSGKVGAPMIASFVLITHSEEHRKAGLDHMISMGCIVLERLDLTLKQMKVEYAQIVKEQKEDLTAQLVRLIEDYWEAIGGPYIDLHGQNVMAKLVRSGDGKIQFKLYLIDLSDRPKPERKTRTGMKRWIEVAKDAIA